MYGASVCRITGTVLTTGPTHRFESGRTNKKPRLTARVFCLYGAPGTIRTCDRLVRSQVLYPAELRALKMFCTVLPGTPFGLKAERPALAYRAGVVKLALYSHPVSARSLLALQATQLSYGR